MADDYCFGLTATRYGMTDAQKDALRLFLAGSTGKIHHGLCVGGDTDGHHIARDLGYWIVGHPPTNAALRADLLCDEMRTEKPYLTRNKNIVDETIALIAAPAEMEEQPRGGTWSTVRYARRQGKAVVLILPDGTINQTNRNAR
jgi:hypothetical protein